jgi:hypothetical protein
MGNVNLQTLLEKLTPAEFYTWAWLCTLPWSPDGRLMLSGLTPPFYSRVQFNRILKALEKKKMLLPITPPGSRSGPRILALSKKAARCIHDSSSSHSCTELPTLSPSASDFDAPVFPEPAVGNPRMERPSPSSRFTGASSSPQLSLALLRRGNDLKAYTTMTQKELVKKIQNLEPAEHENLLNQLAKTSLLPRKRGLSPKAIVFAALRLLQEPRSEIRNPQAWVEAVAQRFDRITSSTSKNYSATRLASVPDPLAPVADGSRK